MNIKRIVSLTATLSLVLSLSLGLSGCGDKAAQDGSPDNTDGSAKYVVGICQLVQHDALDAATRAKLQELFPEREVIPVYARNILIGGGNIAIPPSVKDDVYDLGFVDKQDKYNAMAAAALLCQPSHNESFSLVIMESWLCGRPVLVSSQCAVTKDFAKRSNGGLYFKDYFEFEGCVEYILEHPEAAAELGANGGAFVRENFEWDIIVEKYRTFFQKLMGA